MGILSRWIKQCSQAFLFLAIGAAYEYAAGGSLRFFGNGTGDIDRVKIRIDDPLTVATGPPADVGDTDFTIEFWLRADSGNTSGPTTCGPGNAWIYGNIMIDRDRFNQGRNYGISLAGGVVAFGVMNAGRTAYTLCGTSDLRDGRWHHIAVQRRFSDGSMWVYVDGRLEGTADGPGGDISYPDDGAPGDYCGGPCVNSDPFIVLGAEKHDAGSEFPSFSGWMDELRYSSSLRYGSNFSPAVQAFVPDADTVALYHFDEGSGNLVSDATGGADGVRRYGGNPAGPEWSMDKPFSDGSGDPGGGGADPTPDPGNDSSAPGGGGPVDPGGGRRSGSRGPGPGVLMLLLE